MLETETGGKGKTKRRKVKRICKLEARVELEFERGRAK